MWWADIEVPNNSIDKISKELSACYPWRTFNPLIDNFSTQNYRVTMINIKYFTIRYVPVWFVNLTVKQTYAIILKLLIFLLKWIYFYTPPLLFRRLPSQSNYQPYNIHIIITYMCSWNFKKKKNIKTIIQVIYFYIKFFNNFKYLFLFRPST
jgi:hypothetical protein